MSPYLSGQARATLKNGATYVGHVVYDGRTVTINGHLRVITTIGGERVATRRPARRRTLPITLVREIVWDDDPVRSIV